MTNTNDVSENSIAVDPESIYNSLPPDQAMKLRRAAETINKHARTTGVDVFVVGRELCLVKRFLKRDVFVSWLRREVKLSERTGLRYRRVHERLEVFSDTVSVLSPSELYILSAASPAVINEVVGQMRHGLRVHLERTLVEGKSKPKKVSKKCPQRECGRLTAKTESVDAAGRQLFGPTDAETAALDELARLLIDRYRDLAVHIIGLLDTVGYLELSARLKKYEDSRAELSAPALLRLMSTGTKVHAVREMGHLTLP